LLGILYTAFISMPLLGVTALTAPIARPEVRQHNRWVASYGGV